MSPIPHFSLTPLGTNCSHCSHLPTHIPRHSTHPSPLPSSILLQNIHALDPQSIPTAAALKNARVVVDRLLERQKEEMGGKYPESIAVVLWGTDNIKTYGESLAQVRQAQNARGVGRERLVVVGWRCIHLLASSAYY